ncbi:hypothetical protein ABGB17_34500 [Sphaerisporangium sp. B11E5]|uniref:hypothetical protein n=1 Tax=Sphaerisporangium sp. B11E5 TaxID=3153563 RepID=UPI00325C9E89
MLTMTLLAGCAAGGVNVPDPTPAVVGETSSPSPATAYDAAAVRRLMEADKVTKIIDDGSRQPGPLRAAHGICPHWPKDCQVAYFFYGDDKVGEVRAQILAVEGSDGRVVTLVFPQFGPNDANCCPSRPDRHVHYTFRGGVLEADQSLPPGKVWNYLECTPVDAPGCSFTLDLNSPPPR